MEKELKEIWSWYPIGNDVGDSKHSRAQYAMEQTGLDYNSCYDFMEQLDRRGER